MDRNKKGQFLKGTTPNPNGRPRKKLNLFDEAIKENEEKIIKHYLKMVFSDNEVLLDLMKRILK